MEYFGTKFRFERLSKKSPKDERLPELKNWCQLYHDYGFAPSYEGGSFGNLSFRLYKNIPQFIITCANTSLDKIIDKNFATVTACDFEEKKVYAHVRRKKESSSESMLHFAIYNMRKDINAVFHGHWKIPDKYVKKLGIPVVRDIPYGTIELVEAIIKVLEDNKKVKIIKADNHGFFALGKDMQEAGEFIFDVYEGK